MKLEVGEFYLSASGDVIKITRIKSRYFLNTYDNEYDIDGTYLFAPHPNDLIAHIPKELHYDIIKTIKAYHSDNIIKEYINNIYNNKG